MLAGLQVETTAVAETEGSEAAATISNKATNIVCDFPFHVPQPEHLSRVLLSGLSPCSLRQVRRPAVLGGHRQIDGHMSCYSPGQPVLAAQIGLPLSPHGHGQATHSASIRSCRKGSFQQMIMFKVILRQLFISMFLIFQLPDK